MFVLINLLARYVGCCCGACVFVWAVAAGCVLFLTLLWSALNFFCCNTAGRFLTLLWSALSFFVATQRCASVCDCCCGPRARSITHALAHGFGFGCGSGCAFLFCFLSLAPGDAKVPTLFPQTPKPIDRPRALDPRPWKLLNPPPKRLNPLNIVNSYTQDVL